MISDQPHHGSPGDTFENTEVRTFREELQAKGSLSRLEGRQRASRLELRALDVIEECDRNLLEAKKAYRKAKLEYKLKQETLQQITR